MFEWLAKVIKDYNDSGQGKAVFQAYNALEGKVFILCIITSLISRIYEKIFQAEKLCYVDASASFELLNTLITLFYTSCTIKALLLELLVISDELEITLEKVIFNFLLLLLNILTFTKNIN